MEIMIELRTDYNVYLIFDETLTLTILIIGKVLQETKNICITCVQRRPNVFNVGPTLYKWVKEVTSDY